MEPIGRTVELSGTFTILKSGGLDINDTVGLWELFLHEQITKNFKVGDVIEVTITLRKQNAPS